MSRLLSGLIYSILVCTVLLFGPSQSLSAEQIISSGDSPERLSLEKAIQIALTNNPRMAAVQSQVEASEARRTQVRSGLLPQIDFGERFSRTNNPTNAFSAKLNQESFTQADFDIDRLNDPDPINNFATTFSVTLPIFNSGQTWIGLSQANLDHKASMMAAERTKQEVIADTVRRYAGVQLARANREVVEQALQTAKANLRLIDSRFQSGLVVKSDLLRAEVRVAALEQERFQAQTQLEVALAALNVTMGLEADQVFRLTSSLEQGPELQGSLIDWTSRSEERRADLARLKCREKVAEKGVSRAKAAHLPSVNLAGNYEINSEDFNETGESYTIGAIFNFNLFSGCNLQAKVAEARADLREIQAVRKQLELAIAVEAKQAYLQARSAWQRIQVAEAAVAQADEALRIVRNRYENGLVTVVTLFDAEEALQQARTNYSRSLHDYTVARALLKLAAGALDETFH